MVLLARDLGLPVAQPASIRSAEFLDRVRNLDPDLGVVVAYGRILPQALLDIPRFGFLNVHASLLPAYRGAAPIQRAIEKGETTTGVTIMKVDAELDHGPILKREAIQIGGDERAASLTTRLASAGARVLVEAIAEIEEGRATETEQDHDRATYAARIVRDEASVSWNEPARRIYDRFRAFDPWPGTTVSFREEPLKLIDIELLEEMPGGEPGTILELDDEGIVVAASSGAIRLKTVQRAGRRPMAAAELARARRVHRGDRLS